jgi:hypothetical protein
MHTTAFFEFSDYLATTYPAPDGYYTDWYLVGDEAVVCHTPYGGGESVEVAQVTAPATLVDNNE